MKRSNPLQWLVLPILVFTFWACKKDASSATEDDNKPDVQVHVEDENFFSTEIDAVLFDANTLLEADASVSPRQQDNLICDANLSFDLLSDPVKLTATFDGSDCIANRKREGVIELSAPRGTDWKNAGANFTLEFKDFKVTRTRDGKSITINGRQTYTNTSGGLLLTLAGQQSVVHTIMSDGLSVTFGNGASVNWQVAQKRAFTYDNGIVASVTGTHSADNEENIVFWGTTRFNTPFTSSVTSPLVFRQDCNYRLTAGAFQHRIDSFTATATFGLDAQGNPVSCPAGNFYYKLVWNGADGNTHTVILPY